MLLLSNRCETVLEPGQNCTIRIEKNRQKRRQGSKKTKIFTKNNVVYTCHVCSHRNIQGGTPEGYLKEICPEDRIGAKKNNVSTSGSSVRYIATPISIRESMKSEW